MLNEILAKHSGQEIDKIAADTDRDFFLGAEEAVEYGLVDEILSKPAENEDGSDETNKAN